MQVDGLSAVDKSVVLFATLSEDPVSLSYNYNVQTADHDLQTNLTGLRLTLLHGTSSALCLGEPSGSKSNLIQVGRNELAMVFVIILV